MKTSTKRLSEVELLIDGMEIASKEMNLNPMLTYIRFILTDDRPNSNGVKVPRSEFSNLIRSGFYMPIKMTEGTISSHEGSTPIGVITYLREDGDKIRGIAALWNVERPDDVQLIKDRYAEGKSLDISWEIGYADESTDEFGITSLETVFLRAATLVGIPADGGRTPITEVKSSTDDKEDETTMKEIEVLQARVLELETENSELKEKLANDQLASELEALREYKSTNEEALKRASLLKEIKAKFASNGIKKDDKFFEDNEAMLLALADEKGALDFMLSQVEPDEEDEDTSEETEEEKKKRLEEEGKEESDDEEESDEESDEDEEEEEDSDDDDDSEEDDKEELELEEETSGKKIPNLKGKKTSKKKPSTKDLANSLRETKKK